MFCLKKRFYVHHEIKYKAINILCKKGRKAIATKQSVHETRIDVVFNTKHLFSLPFLNADVPKSADNCEVFKTFNESFIFDCTVAGVNFINRRLLKNGCLSLY